jgi:hypothetical protein
MLGKTFNGLTDEMLRWQTTRLLNYQVVYDIALSRIRPMKSDISFVLLSDYDRLLALRYVEWQVKVPILWQSWMRIPQPRLSC